MKKAFTMICALFLCLFSLVSLQAQTTYTFSDYPAGVQYAENEEHVLDNSVTIYTTKCHFTTQLRVYSSATYDGYFQSNALPFYIESLSFNMGYKADSVAIYGSTDASSWTLVGVIATSTNYQNLSISFGNNDFNFFKFDVLGTQQVRVTSMTINYKATSPGATCQMPSFSVPAGILTTPTDVALTCNTPNASIYYTTDGTNPDSTSTLYSSPIHLTQTTTIKAIAYAAGNNHSPIASNTYNFPSTVANIAAFKATATSTNSTPYTITGDITYVYRNGSYMFVKDATGGLLIYDNSVITTTYNEGDIISGGITGTLSVYSNQYEMIPVFNTPAATSSTTVTPTVVSIADILSNYSQYDASFITLQNVTLGADLSYTAGTQGTTTAISQNGSSMAIFNRFKTLDTTMTSGTTTDITGFIGIFNSTIQIYPRSNADLLPQSLTPQPSLSILSPANGANYSTLDTLNVDLNIQNFVLGTDGLLKVECPLLTTVGLTNPMYFDATTWALFQNQVLSPLPAGNFTATLSLVNTDYSELSTPVSATTNFTVTAPVLDMPVITATGDQASSADSYYLTATVTLSHADADATIYYTTDGTNPDETANVYSAPFNVTTTSTIKAIAGKNHYANSDVATKTITIETPTVANPVFAPVAGTYADSVVVTLTCTTADADVRYTTDGTVPTETSTLYTDAITLTSTATVTAKAFKANWNASEAVSAVYTIAHEAALTAAPSVLNFNSTTLSQEITVTSAFLTSDITLSCTNTHFTVTPTTIPAATSSAIVTVTFDGTEPASAVINLVSGDLTAQVALNATATLAAPVITPAATTDTAVTVTITSANNANIYYTLDGTTPDANANLYSAPIVLNTPGTYTVSAIAILTNWENSAVASETYTIVLPTPVVTIADTLAYYTGFEPTEGFVLGTQYNNTTEVLNGTTNQWATVYGTVSTTSPICDTASMQMRWYANAATTMGYTRTDFDITHATRMTFAAKSTNGLNVTVSYSTDGGNNYVDTTYVLSSDAHNYELIVSETAQYDNVRFKFAIALPETAPTSTSRVYIDSVCIFNFPSMISGTVDMPVINPVAGNVFEATDVTITCATQGATIYYTLDGTTPDESSNLYTAPFTLNSTTTVKAIAVKAGFNNSNIATATYNFPVEVANIAAFKAANTASNSTVYKITGDVTFVYRNNRNVYIQDASGALLLYDQSNIITNTYYDGDIISGGICGTFTLYNGLTEMVPVANPAVSVSNLGTVTPVVADMETIIDEYENYESRLVTIQNVTFTDGGTYTTASASNLNIEQDGGIMQCRNQFKTLELDIPAGQVADVTGFIIRYATSSGENFQIAPRTNSDIAFVVEGDTVETPVITVERLTNSMYAVDITCATEGASIYYTLDGTTPDANATLYNEGFLADAGVAIKAIAVKEGMINSAIAIYAYTSVADHTADNVTVYPNPTTGKCVITDGSNTIETVMVYDLFGKLLSAENCYSNNAVVDLSSYNNGTYFVRLTTNNGIVTKKVVLAR